jgi:hypothetical protein
MATDKKRDFRVCMWMREYGEVRAEVIEESRQMCDCVWINFPKQTYEHNNNIIVMCAWNGKASLELLKVVKKFSRYKRGYKKMSAG